MAAPRCFISFRNTGDGHFLAKNIKETLHYYNCEVYFFADNRAGRNYRTEEIKFLNKTDYFIIVITDDLIADLRNSKSECRFELKTVYELNKKRPPEKQIGILTYLSETFNWETPIRITIEKKTKEIEKKTILTDAFGEETADDLIRNIFIKYAGSDHEIGNDKKLIEAIGLIYHGYEPPLKTLSGDGIFLEPEEFTNPQRMIKLLAKNAFRNNRKVHVISGRRGMGKTSLAQFFAEQCAKNLLRPERPELVFKNIIFKDYEENGLKTTIEMLELNREEDHYFSYNEKLQLLRDLEGPKLLIIDNYDSDRFEQELSDSAKNESVYRDIINTGCFILITSRKNMQNCPGLSQTTIEPLAVKNLSSLFIKLAGLKIKSNDPDLKVIITDYLQSNTYLVRLTAKLMEWQSVEDIRIALENHRMNDFEDIIQGRDNSDDTWFGHFSKLFDMAGIENDEDKLRLLYNTALLPPGGITFTDFREYIVNNDTGLKKAFDYLTKGFWILKTENEKDRIISMHPVLRDLLAIKKDLFHYEYVEKYILLLNSKLLFHAYNRQLLDMVKLGIEASAILDILGVNKPEIAYLNAMISADYDIVNNNDQAYYYGVRAISMLDSLETEIKSDPDIYHFAMAYNLAGYAVLHAKKEENYLDIAYQSLTKAAELIRKIYNDETTDQTTPDTYKDLYQINRGDLAAYHLGYGIQLKNNKEYASACQEFQEALETHRNNIILRQKWIEEEPTSAYPKKERTKKLAASYTGVGTNMYYLALNLPGLSDEQKKDYLRGSFDNHSLAVKNYKDAYSPEYHIQIATAENRKAGALLLLMDADEYSPEKKIEIGHQMIKDLVEAVNYMISMEYPNIRELDDSKDKLKGIIDRIQDIDGIDHEVISQGLFAIHLAEVRLSQ